MGPAVGQDCAVLDLQEDEVLVLSTDPITGTARDIGRHSIQITVNDLAATGAEPIGVMLSMLLTEEVDEPQLRTMMQEIEAVCSQLGIEVLGGHTEITKVVSQPVITVTGVGKARKDRICMTNQMQPRDDLVVTKWIALEGSSIIAKEKEAQLKQFLPASLVDTTIAFDRYLSVLPESRIAMQIGVHAMHDITEGGIFGALWEMAEGAACGLEIDLKKIPIRQESIEVCERYGVNPYLLMSSGSMLIATEDGPGLVRALLQEGIHSAIIGRATDTKDRILYRGEEIRYLDRPQSDELYRVV